MVHVNYGSYTLAIREGDWKLILPSDVYVVEDGTVTPDHLVETTRQRPEWQIPALQPPHRSR
jgi:hypothetical protein